jgi:hypothetical protein
MDILAILVKFIDNPTVIAAIVALLTGLLPAATVAGLYAKILGYFEKVPLLGVLVKIFGAYVDRVMATNEAKKTVAASEAAEVLVRGAEQLKTLGKLDGPTAAMQVTAKIAKDYRLDSDTARKVTEAAVRDMHAWEQ